MSEDVIRLDLPASYKYLNVLGACLAEMLQRVEGLRDAPEQIGGVQLAVHEVCTNIVDHAYQDMPGGRIEITLVLSQPPPCLRVMVHDTGRAFDYDRAPLPNLDVPQEGGYGLFLVGSLMDEVKYSSRPAGNDWHLIKYLK